MVPNPVDGGHGRDGDSEGPLDFGKARVRGHREHRLNAAPDGQRLSAKAVRYLNEHGVGRPDRLLTLPVNPHDPNDYLVERSTMSAQ